MSTILQRTVCKLAIQSFYIKIFLFFSEIRHLQNTSQVTLAETRCTHVKLWVTRLASRKKGNELSEVYLAAFGAIDVVSSHTDNNTLHGQYMTKEIQKFCSGCSDERMADFGRQRSLLATCSPQLRASSTQVSAVVGSMSAV